MNRVVFFSGGAGSWGAAKRVKEQHGVDDLHLLFTDTMIEDKDLYRFLLEGTDFLYPQDQGCLDSLLKEVDSLPPVISDENVEIRKEKLPTIADKANELFPILNWIYDGRSVWDIFFDEQYLGDTRADPCSKILKRNLSHKWIEDNFDPEDTTLYIGIDWTEIHRMDSVWAAWEPYTVEAPLTEPPYLAKHQILEQIKEKGIEIPRLYKEGAAHNNCAGFCVKAGHGAFTLLYRQRPKVYAYHEQKEQEIREFLGRDVSILRDRRGGTTTPLTLTALRNRIESEGEHQINMLDQGGCGCFVDSEEQND